MATSTVSAREISTNGTTLAYKYSMALAGLLFVFYVLMHMYGNLKILWGAEAFNGYAHHLRILGEPILPYEGFLWLFRLLLLAALFVHVGLALPLWSRANKARSTRYVVKRTVRATFASKMMRWGGVALLAFIVFHLLQFTILKFNVGSGQFPDTVVDPTTHETIANPYPLVVSSFQVWWVVLIYALAMFALAMHLRHGVWSAGQTLGLTGTPAKARAWNLAGIAIAAIVSIGFIVPPLAILFGLVGK